MEKPLTNGLLVIVSNGVQDRAYGGYDAVVHHLPWVHGN